MHLPYCLEQAPMGACNSRKKIRHGRLHRGPGPLLWRYVFPENFPTAVL